MALAVLGALPQTQNLVEGLLCARRGEYSTERMALAVLGALPQTQNLVECLLCAHRGEYSAERMALAVLGAQPLPELEAWAAELFAAVPSGAGPRPTFPHVGPPYEARPASVAGPALACEQCVQRKQRKLCLALGVMWRHAVLCPTTCRRHGRVSTRWVAAKVTAAGRRSKSAVMHS